MLARCTHCESTFVTGQFGRQRCPKCGVEVLVEDPRVSPDQTAPAAPAPVEVEEPAAEATATPWERRAELGFFRGLGMTFSAVMSRPGPFFRSMKYDSDEGALGYYALVALVPVALNAVIQWATLKPKELQDAYKQLQGMGVEMPRQLLDELLKYATFSASRAGLFSSLILTVGGLFIGLFAIAGTVHLILSLFGKAKGGWTATFKGTVYSATPFVIWLLPNCGSLIATTWATGLQIYAMSRAHKISVGWATAGVIGFHAVFLTGCCGVFMIAFSAAGLAH